MQLKTKNGYSLSEVASAMQKAVRRGDAKMAAFWAVEIWYRYDAYVWRRLLTISAEDCWGVITTEVEALSRAYDKVNVSTTRDTRRGRIFVAKAALLMGQAPKSRDADHLTNLVYDSRMTITDEQLEAELEEARQGPLPEIPAYAYDCHTSKGKKAGKTKADFFQVEHAALNPRQPGLFDHLISKTLV